MTAMNKYKSINEYLADFDEPTQKDLKKLSETILTSVPEAKLTFSYGIPTYKINGKTVIHFAAYKNHIGLYPGPRAINAFADKLTDYKTSKGTIQLPLDKEIPYELIAKISAKAAELNL